MTVALSIAVGVLVVLAITVATGFFVAQEFAYMAVDRAGLAAAAASGNEAAGRALEITKRTSFMLSGAQLGITVTGLIVGYVAEPLIGQGIGTVLGGGTRTWAMALGGTVALVFSTVVQMLLGELVPKNYSIAMADRAARVLARPTRLYLLVAGPVIWVFDRAAELFLRLLRMEPVHDVDHSATDEDLAHVIEASRDTGQLTPALSTVLDRIIDFPRRDVEHAMMPRPRVGIVRADAPLADVREQMATEHTRYPVLDADDRLVGVVHLVDLLGEDVDPMLPAARIARQPLVVPPTMMLPRALAELRTSGEQLACVIDEYGGFAGIITIEDLAEEVVGEITDEHDPHPVTDLPEEVEGAWVVAGDTPLDEIERALRVELPDTDSETISGLVIEAHGALPDVGDRVTIALVPDPAAPDGAVQPARLEAEVLAVDSFVPASLSLVVAGDGDRTGDDASRAERSAPAVDGDQA